MTNVSRSSAEVSGHRNLGDAARDAKRSVAEEGKRLADDTVEQAEDIAKERQTAAATYIRSLSSAIQDGGRSLDDRGHGNTADVVNRAASEIDELATALAEKSPRDLLREIETFARDRPAVFFGAALLAGFGIARFLKSAPPETRGEDRRSDHGGTVGVSGQEMYSGQETHRGHATRGER